MAEEIHQELLEALGKVDRPETFCASGRLPPVLPGLEVAGVGPVSLPLGKTQAADLKKRAHQAPYGKGEQTLVDTNVRRVWEIDADEVTLANPEWPDVLRQTIQSVQSELGLDKQKLTGHLYKLLLYEPGSFFVAHRDGEKLDRMVGTLVIALPSAHEGGELAVRHEGREETVDFGGPGSQFHTRYAAFYADCEHEIRPVKSGFRLTLVYNLTLEKSKRRITAPTSGKHIEAVSRVLSKWKADPSPQKLAVILDHQYTKAGLTFDALKGVDRAQANVLFGASRQSGCDAHLALVTLWQSGAAEPIGGYGPHLRYGYDDDDADDHQMGEVIDRTLSAEQFSDASGNPASFGVIPLQDDEIVSELPLSDDEPDEEDFEGYTGNAGMTLAHWYHRAAVVLWPAAARFDVLCTSGVASAVGGLQQMVNHLPTAGKDEKASLNEQCLQFADRIIANWPSREFADRVTPKAQADQPSLLSLLEKLGDTRLVASWIRNVFGRDASVDPGETLGDICQQHGWLTFQNELQHVFENTTNETIERNARLLADWCLRKGDDADSRELCKSLAHVMVDALEEWDARQAKDDWRARTVEREELLPPLVQSCLALGETELLQRLVDHIVGLPKKYDLTQVQMPAIITLRSWFKRELKRSCRPLQTWIEAVRRELESRATNPLQEPTDWRRESTIPCTCTDCKQLSRFLDDPREETLRLPLVEQRRRHLHQMIDGNQLDLKHATERRGRPYTLVCTKTQASYEKKLNTHRVDLKHLQTIQAMRDWHSGLKRSPVRA